MQGVLALLMARLAFAGGYARGKVVIGTVKDDPHDIGKNLVVIMPQGDGFEVIDLGNAVKPEQVVTPVREHQPNFVKIS